MNVEIKEQMYEGKAKQVFATSDPEIVMVHYKDDATAGDGEKKGTIRCLLYTSDAADDS